MLLKIIFINLLFILFGFNVFSQKTNEFSQKNNYKKRKKLPDTIETDTSIIIYKYTCSATEKIIIPKYKPHILIINGLKIYNTDSVFFFPYNLLSNAKLNELRVIKGVVDTLFFTPDMLLILNGTIIKKTNKKKILKQIKRNDIIYISDLSKERAIKKYGWFKGKKGALIIKTK